MIPKIAFRNAALAAELRQIGNDASASTASQSSNLQGVRATHSSEWKEVLNLIVHFTAPTLRQFLVSHERFSTLDQQFGRFGGNH